MINSSFENFRKNLGYYLLFVLIFAFIQLYIKHTGGTDSTISEWLINYQGGFVRRGFLGELFFQIATIFNIKIRFVIFIFQIIMYGSFLFFIFKFFNTIKKNFIIVLCIFSPLLIIYHIAEVETLARKEVLLFIHFLILLLYFNQKNKQIIYLSITYPFLMLIWEPIVFFSGFYALIVFVDFEFKNISNFLKKIILPFLPAVFVFFLIIFNKYTVQNQDLMCSNLKEFVNETCYMSLGYVTTSIKDNYMSLFGGIEMSYIFRYALALFVGFFPLMVIVFNLKKTINIKNQFVYNRHPFQLFLIASFPVIFLFAMGLDWGRWCNIFYFYSITTFFYLINKNFYVLKIEIITQYLNNIVSKSKITYVGIFLFLAFSFTWNLKTTFKEDIGSLPIYRVPAKTIKHIFAWIRHEN